jgi:hypothetical protein
MKFNKNWSKMMEFHTFSELFANIPVSWKKFKKVAKYNQQ